MRSPSRLRRIAKWTGACACILILAAWSVSLFFLVYVPVGERDLLIESGLILIYWDHSDTTFYYSSFIEKIRWNGFGVEWPNTGYWRSAHFGVIGLYLKVPFWLVLLPAIVLTAFLFYRDRRSSPAGHCQHCGYDIRGIKSGICPECGKKKVYRSNDQYLVFSG